MPKFKQLAPTRLMEENHEVEKQLASIESCESLRKSTSRNEKKLNTRNTKNNVSHRKRKHENGSSKENKVETKRHMPTETRQDDKASVTALVVKITVGGHCEGHLHLQGDFNLRSMNDSEYTTHQIGKFKSERPLKRENHSNTGNLAVNQAAKYSTIQNDSPAANIAEPTTNGHSSFAASSSPCVAASMTTSSSDSSDCCSRCEIAITPTERDVLMGRGKDISEWPGNIHFRLVVHLFRETYLRAARSDKVHIAAAVIKSIQTQPGGGGRFLEQQKRSFSSRQTTRLEEQEQEQVDQPQQSSVVCESTAFPGTGWVEIRHERAVEKCCQALREIKGRLNPLVPSVADMMSMSFGSASAYGACPDWIQLGREKTIKQEKQEVDFSVGSNDAGSFEITGSTAEETMRHPHGTRAAIRKRKATEMTNLSSPKSQKKDVSIDKTQAHHHGVNEYPRSSEASAEDSSDCDYDGIDKHKHVFSRRHVGIDTESTSQSHNHVVMLLPSHKEGVHGVVIREEDEGETHQPSTTSASPEGHVPCLEVASHKLVSGYNASEDKDEDDETVMIRLEEFVRETGHCAVPPRGWNEPVVLTHHDCWRHDPPSRRKGSDHFDDSLSLLADWCTAQRQVYREVVETEYRPATLEEHARLERLEKMGFVWNYSAWHWNEHYQTFLRLQQERLTKVVSGSNSNKESETRTQAAVPRDCRRWLFDQRDQYWGLVNLRVHSHESVEQRAKLAQINIFM